MKQILESLFSNSIIVEKIDLDVQETAHANKFLVNEAIKKRRLKTYSDVWVVFDKDDNKDFDEAIALAKKGKLTKTNLLSMNNIINFVSKDTKTTESFMKSE